jgi:hypothetical protein
MALHTSFPPQIKTQKEAFDAFIVSRKRLKKAASDAFTDFTPPPAVTLPKIVDNTDFNGLLRPLADSRLNLVVGEVPAQQSGKAQLNAHLKALKDAGYDTLYMEHLMTDLHQADLDQFYRTQHMPERLKTFLKDLDNDLLPFDPGNHTYTEVVQAAAKNNLRIRALDCTSSYHVSDFSDPDLSRKQMFSYFATQVIEADQLANGPHPWVAFVSSKHTNYNLGVPGLADTLGAVGLHIRDAAPELARGIHRGVWEVTDSGTGGANRALRADFTMDVAVAGKNKPAAVVSVDRSKLIKAGDFLIERPSSTEAILVHKSGTGDIVTTPIQVDDKGLLYVDRWGKQNQRFKYLHKLIEMLIDDKKMRPVL